MIEIKCECGHKLVIFPHHAGTTMPCAKCDQDHEVPFPEGYVPPPKHTGPAGPPRKSLLEKIFGFLRGE